ncbi:MAG TPA: hypothetical protein PKH77_09060 [Anaerolineae bacterium]|nr:hypothetical protein [Anaerolineae bacterium]
MANSPLPVSFWQEFFWEFVQNIVLLTGFFIALALWRQGRFGPAVGCMLIGGVLGAWNIRWIEAKFKGHAESLKVTWTNSVMMPLLMLVFVAYLAASWSSGLTDLIIGAAGGFALSAAQRLSIKASLDVWRSAAFAIAFPLTLVSIRALATLPLALTILASTFIVTLLIVAIHQGSKKWGRS